MSTGCVNGKLHDPRAYFFTDVIQRQEGAPAPDWKAVLESLPGKGMGINPKPGEIQPPNAPFYGITVMIDAGGNARGRIWLPSDGPPNIDNGNAWYTHEIQVIADGPTPGSIVWAWIDKGGAPYSPHACDSGTQPPDPPTPPHDETDARLDALEAQMAMMQDELLKMRGDMREIARSVVKNSTIDVRVGTNLYHGHPASATIRP